MKTITNHGTYLEDEYRNKATIAYYGSEESARTALNTLGSDCSGCSDCYDCSGCSGCAGCSGCSRCSRCYGCSGCSRCSDCSDCSRCSDCSGCSRCSDCSGCSPEKNETPVPVIENIHRAVYAAASGPKALNMGDWHTCETTHCRAGWVVHLAGKPGYELEKKTSSVFAAMQIYKASGYKISPVKFFGTNEAALADMKQLAEASK